MRYLVILSAAWLPVVVGAQTTNAGDVLRDAERRPLELPQRQSLELNLPDAPLPEASKSGPALRVSRFSLSGNESIATDELLPLLADLQGREVTLGELQSGAHRITRWYRERGYPLARAYLPAQEIAAGVVEVAVLEGRFGQVNIENGAQLRGAALKPAAGLRSGTAVQADALERSLLLLQDMPGVAVKAVLEPGAEVGESDLNVRVDRDQRISGQVGVDNFGNRFVGEYRLGGTLNLENPLRLGDELSLRGLYSDEDQQYLRLSYQLPVGNGSTRVGVSYTDMDYQLAGDFEVLDVRGGAHIPAIWLSQTIVRSRDLSVYAQLEYEHKQLEDRVGLFDTISRKRLESLTLTVSGNSHDDVLGGGVNSFSLGWSRGDLDIQSAQDRLADAATAQTAGYFNKYSLSLARLQRLTPRFGLQLQAQGQWADKNLDSVEKLSLGGAYGVRAYAQGEGNGAEGWLTSVELQYALAPGWQIATFYDYGDVTFNERPWTPGDNDRDISAGGLGLRWATRGWRLDATVAWELDGAGATGDGDDSPRWWTRMVRNF